MDWTTDNVGNNNKDVRLSDLVELLVVPDGEGKDIRLIGPARRVAKHWIPINTKTGKVARIPRVCLAFNDDTGQFDGECPYCEIDPKRPGIEVHQNAIDRDAQEAQPARIVPPNAEEKVAQVMKGYKTRIKRNKSSKAWTPVRLAVMNNGHSNPIKDMVGMNKKKVRDADGNPTVKLFGPEHPTNGFDVTLMYHSTRAAAQKYSAQKGDNTAISDEERRYLLWDIYTDQPKPLKEAKTDAADLAKRVVREDGDDAPAPKAGARAGKARETTIDDDEDWDNDEAPAKPARGGGGGGRRAAEPEDDFDDEPPARSRKPARAAAPAEDDFDDEPAPRRGAKPSRRAPEPEDDFEDEPAPRRGAKPARRAAAEDDFDDEPAPARGRGRPAPVEDDEFADDPPPRRNARRAEPEDDFDDEPAPRRRNTATREAPPARGGRPKPRAPEPDDDDLGADDDGWDDD